MSGPVTPDFQHATETQQGFPHRVSTAALNGSGETGVNPLMSNTDRGTDEYKGRNSWDQAIRRRYKFHDRGTGQYEEQRTAGTKPYLVMTGRHAGRSHLHLLSFDWRKWTYHLWTRDFFTSVASVNLLWICVGMLGIYTLSYVMWAFAWYMVWVIDGQCLAGFTGNSFTWFYTFSVATQATIGYGNLAAYPCWTTAFVLTLQNVFGMILDAVYLGIIFAKISHPKHRGRSVMISECAVIARRNGLLKFMFRIADVRSHTACDAKVRAFLYTWGEGRHTMEGEHIPVRVECLNLGNVDGMLLLPLTLEHTIDERSPLHGLHHDLLAANNCEVVVTFEAVNEFGDSFMCRQSYLANEIHWGHVFTCIIQQADSGLTQHTADLSRFHDVEPQPNLPVLPPGPLSMSILASGTMSRMLPYPLLGDNTLVISQFCTITYRGGTPCLMFRVGDTRPCQMLEVHVRMYLYDWTPTTTPEGEFLPYTVQEVDLGYEQGNDRLILRFPQTVCHEIGTSSPLVPWLSTDGSTQTGGSHAELVVIVESVMYITAENMMRSVTYRLPRDIRYNHHFKPMVSRSSAAQSVPSVDWSSFHDTCPPGAATRHSLGQSTRQGDGVELSTQAPHAVPASLAHGAPAAPEPGSFI